MPSLTDIQYLSDASGTAVGTFVPIERWHQIESERETAYLLRNRATMAFRFSANSSAGTR